MEHKQYSRGRASLLRSSSFGSSRNTTCGEKELSDETKNGSVRDWVGSGMSKKVYRRGWLHGSVGNAKVLVSILVEALNFFEAFFIHNRIAKWRLGAWSIPGLPQQRNPATSPHTEGQEREPAALKNISGKRTIVGGGGWGGGGTKVAESNHVAWTTQQEGKSPRHWITWGRSELLGMRMPKDRGPLALKTLLVVNSHVHNSDDHFFLKFTLIV